MRDTKNSTIKSVYCYQELFVALLFAMCGQQVCGMQSQGHSLISVIPHVIPLNVEQSHSCHHVKSTCRLVARVLFRKLALRSGRWAYGFVQQHPKKIVGTALVMGFFAGGYHYLSKMTGKSHTLLDNHEKRVTEDIDAFEQVDNGAKSLRSVNGALQQNINTGFDSLEADTQNVMNMLTEFGDSFQKSLGTLGDSTQELAKKDGLRSLGREIGGLATDVVSVLESQPGKTGGLRQALKKDE